MRRLLKCIRGTRAGLIRFRLCKTHSNLQGGRPRVPAQQLSRDFVMNLPFRSRENLTDDRCRARLQAIPASASRASSLLQFA